MGSRSDSLCSSTHSCVRLLSSPLRIPRLPSTLRPLLTIAVSGSRLFSHNVTWCWSLLASFVYALTHLIFCTSSLLLLLCCGEHPPFHLFAPTYCVTHQLIVAILSKYRDLMKVHIILKRWTGLKRCLKRAKFRRRLVHKRRPVIIMSKAISIHLCVLRDSDVRLDLRPLLRHVRRFRDPFRIGSGETRRKRFS